MERVGVIVGNGKTQGMKDSMNTEYLMFVKDSSYKSAKISAIPSSI